MSTPSTSLRRVDAIVQQLCPTTNSQFVTPVDCSSSSVVAAGDFNDSDVVIVGYARTAIGGAPLNGCLSHLTAPELGAVAIRSAVSRAGIASSEIEEVFFGNVLSAGIGQAPARQAALLAGLPNATPCTTLNKVCASGMKSLMFAADSIRAGSRNVIVCGGMESMSNAPFLLKDTRNGKGLRVGHHQCIDSMIHDGLTDAYHRGVHMGTAAELTAQKYGITREQQDAYAKMSYERAQAATKAGRFVSEIVPIQVTGKDGSVKSITADEEVFRANFARFGSLKPTFPTTVKGISPSNQPAPKGTITAANSSVIGDGAAALVLMSGKKAKQLRVKPLAVLVSHADAALEPLLYTIAPEQACRQAITKAGLSSPDAIDVWELNEAFSLVSLVNMKLLNIPENKINLNGGAVSLGHPIGCSGARIICTLISVLEQQNKTYGCASLCNGGGGASAVVIRRI